METVDEKTTLIRISKDFWRELNALKNPGDSFEDVIKRLINKGKD